MKLFYDGVDLATLGTLRILAHTTQREPAEAPQRERVTYRVRLDFFEQSFVNNFGLIEQVRQALKTQNATLLWQDDNGSTYLDRTVTAGDDESTDEALTRGGTYWQALLITFWFYNHDVVTNCLSATFQRSGGQLLTFSTVEKFEQRLATTRYDELRSPRKTVIATLSAAGRIQGDTTSDLATRQAALQAQKDIILSEMELAEDGTFIFGTLNRVVRVTQFTAEINQPNNYIAWSLTATYTLFPDETDYALIDVRIQNRENLSEGIKFLILSGKIGAPTAALATARLNELVGALRPANYVTLVNDVTQPQMQTESNADEADLGDGPVFTEIQFNIELRDSSSIGCTYQRTVANAPTVSLGTVDRVRDSFSSQLFDEMREQRRRVGGSLSLSGKWYVADSLADADKQIQLMLQKTAMDTEILKGTSGTLLYASNPKAPFINQVVRVIDFNSDVNRLRNCIEWSLTATFTRFPDETNYAVCEIQIGTRQDRNEGIVTMTLNGRIGAPTPEAAQTKLAALRTTLIPAGFILKTDSNQEHQVSVESDGNAPDETFIELTINEEYQQQSGNVLDYKLRRTDDDDFKTGWVRTVFSGTVRAAGATQDSAFTTAENQAALLGDGKYPFEVRTSVIQISNQVLTDGSVIVVVEFSYEYQQKGTHIFTEVVSELNEETFGMSIETVSGYIAAPSLTLAQTTYLNDVRNVALYNGGLLFNERTPTLSQQRLDDNELAPLSALDDRYAFSFQVLHPKDDSRLAIRYSFQTQSNLQALEKTTTIEGTVFASTEDVANAFLDTFLTGLTLGVRVNFTRTPRFQQGPQVTGGDAPASVMTQLDFTETYVDILVGVVSGILMSECSEDLTYSGARLVEKPIPDGPSIIQTVGVTCGKRVVSARAIATTDTSAQAWIKTIRLALLSANHTYEEAPAVVTAFKFLPLTAGVPNGESVNVWLFEVNAKFSELLPVNPFSP